ncbi:MAG: hypothetical protein NTY05_14300 [Rhodocyclales bacterium]|nr:hypothetical protein [Rhodocyclales bacterium]
MSKQTSDVDSTAPPIAIAKIATCLSLSGLCELEYHVGYEIGAKDRICLRIWSSSGSGLWNRDWKYLSDIEQVLSKNPGDALFRVTGLRPVYAGQSANSHSFLAAVLKAEKLIALAGTVEGEYARCNADVWWRELQALVEAGTNLPPPSMGVEDAPIVVPVTKASKKSPKKVVAPAANA